MFCRKELRCNVFYKKKSLQRIISGVVFKVQANTFNFAISVNLKKIVCQALQRCFCCHFAVMLPVFVTLDKYVYDSYNYLLTGALLSI